MPECLRRVLALAALAVAAASHAAGPASRHLAPGFEARAAQSRLVVLPMDLELFSISAGGVEEPRADWTDAAARHLREALAKRSADLGSNVQLLADADMDEFGEFMALQRAVGAAIFIHHARPNLPLPTKGGLLKWSLGDAAAPVRARTGADYALFAWIRDSYASPERKATIVAMALLGAVSFGGEQVGYACLVDLASGRVVWFNGLYRLMGDLREPAGVEETLDTLLEGFPGVRR